jgi:hypothetical protein
MLMLASRPRYRLKADYPRAHRGYQLLPGKGQGDQIRARAAPAPADGPRPDVNEANTRARGPGLSPRSCATVGSARGDPACHAAQTVCSLQLCAGRESDSPGSTPPHARCRSYGTGRRRLSLGSRPKEWTACAGGRTEKLRPFPQSRRVAAVAAGVRSNASTIRRGCARR